MTSKPSTSLASQKSALDYFSDGGVFASKLEGFQVRSAQITMAAAVEEAILEERHCLVEAGTGTGKTFAYLLPAILSDKKVIVSTGTKNLQDQLFYRDLPALCEMLEIEPDLALLKGRGNYLCHYRLEQNASHGRFARRDQAAQIQAVKIWSTRTKTGDLSQMSNFKDDPGVRQAVTSNADNCLGADCEYYGECFVVKARRRAMDAQVVVVNHHLLLADLALKEDGFGELLPDSDVVVVDEAHQLPEVANHFYGETLSSRQLLELCRDCELAYHAEAKDFEPLQAMARRCEKAVRDFQLLFIDKPNKGQWRPAEFRSDLNELASATKELAEILEPIYGRGKALESCMKRAEQASEQLALMSAEQDHQYNYWYEKFKQSFSIHLTPLNIASHYQRSLAEQTAKSWIFTSATLAVEGQFAHFQDALGLDEVSGLCLDSPFDFKSRAIIYVPRQLPDPASPDYTDLAVKAAVPILQHNGGNAFFLFTSHRALQRGAELLREQLDYPIFVQGEKNKTELLDDFRDADNGVLLGTSSFWEGIDVQGEKLSCVVIDKLPFSSPGDPILSARIEACRREGKNAFGSIQLPNAILALKQGCGRLIRDTRDYGILMLCDPRLVAQNYGSQFLESLPPMSRTRDEAIALEFMTRLREDYRNLERLETKGSEA